MKTDKPYIDKPELRRARREAIKKYGRKALTEGIKEAKTELIFNPKMGMVPKGKFSNAYQYWGYKAKDD
jgi:hypothetical protein